MPPPEEEEEDLEEEDWEEDYDEDEDEYEEAPEPKKQKRSRPPTPVERTFEVPPPPEGALGVCAAPSKHVQAECTVENLGKRGEIATGICFLDHMIDQLQSHGQLGVTLRCRVGEDEWTRPNQRRSTHDHDRDVVQACGEALGKALRQVALRARTRPPHVELVRFFCPLDEACAECCICLFPPVRDSVGADVRLEPYGTHAAGPRGRQFVGTLWTRHVPLFWRAVARGLGSSVALARWRGANAHHVLESSFKAFARCFRKCLDRVGGGVAPAARDAHRTGSRRRVTKETTIDVGVDLDGAYAAADAATGAEAAWDGAAKTPPQLAATITEMPRISTGVDLLDQLLDAFAKAATVQVKVQCRGDRYIDDHHSAEDVAISLGQCLLEAVGDKAGLRRMAFATRRVGQCEVRAVLDLSNRPHVTSDLNFDEEYLGNAAPLERECGRALTSEMTAHALESLAIESRCTLHLFSVEDAGGPGHTLDLALAAFEAFGAALGEAVEADPRRKGGVASSKGTLSV